jgi:mannose-6-phosphate isomerase
MAGVERVTGLAQHYAWGDVQAIPSFLGTDADGQPWAEWWLGTHPGGPATLDDGRPLSDVSGELPYLLKVLAAAEPLSLQTHPSRAQAVAGYAREDAAGIDIDDPLRIYTDPNPKPELICALTSFEALCGFRPVVASIQLCEELRVDTVADSLRSDGLATTVRRLYRGELALDPIVDACLDRRRLEARLVTELAEQYPGDPSIGVTLLLNRVTLAPGEAIYLGPGNLHAYLEGVGVEIMGASDNVVRGGLTQKHVDVEELLRVLVIAPLPDPRTPAVEDSPGRWRYDTPDTPFRLWRFEVAGAFEHTATGHELVLCASGATDVLERGETIHLSPGEHLSLHGIATLFRVEDMTARHA